MLLMHSADKTLVILIILSLLHLTYKLLLKLQLDLSLCLLHNDRSNCSLSMPMYYSLESKVTCSNYAERNRVVSHHTDLLSIVSPLSKSQHDPADET